MKRDMEADHNRRGLIRLMLRMPAVRGQLQVLAAHDDQVRHLCGAFEEASVTLDRLRLDPRERHGPNVAEYEAVCAGIENDILAICRDDAERGRA